MQYVILVHIPTGKRVRIDFDFGNGVVHKGTSIAEAILNTPMAYADV